VTIAIEIEASRETYDPDFDFEGRKMLHRKNLTHL